MDADSAYFSTVDGDKQSNWAASLNYHSSETNQSKLPNDYVTHLGAWRQPDARNNNVALTMSCGLVMKRLHSNRSA